MPRPPALLTAVLAAVTVTGCGLSDPLNDQFAADTPATVPVDNELPGSAQGPTTPVANPATTAVVAVQRYGRRYINWDYRSLKRVQQQLAASSVGAASAMNARAAARIDDDYELRRGRIANRGEIVALAPHRGVEATAVTRRFVVVTLELTTGGAAYDGLRPATHVTFAVARRIAGGWVISAWEPQS
ncbi:hypothetical protein Q5424_04785 [Conexibacter sp. JD483]|uniref:hypothetical protein n=1 Tax=unclassified Conexibacter TaxID=2627773 RepID=UPI0027181743|nr:MULTISPECIES: hypothetical protein [unclassified Conexibacter]MDO8184648.1 hypothetical protein [Conexibacter sp. CPCC 205706]MDO8197954.1 hypothetical protein [Conexibacter sp. CPCC 205762]MDR9368384.1 hypothetical protein [Conexibacter sp. JD483]